MQINSGKLHTVVTEKKAAVLWHHLKKLIPTSSGALRWYGLHLVQGKFYQKMDKAVKTHDVY